MLWCLRTVVAVCIVAVCSGRYIMRPLGYLKLPFTVDPTETYQIMSGSAEEAAFDPANQLIYVVGEGSRLLHVVDISNPMSPKRVFTRHFNPTDGVPRDVEVCKGQVAVAMSSEVSVFPGHVQFFKGYDKTSDTMVYEGRVTVGEFPDVLKYTSDCATLVVGNEGRSGLDYAKRYVDPEGTVTIIYTPTQSNPSERFVDFNQFNNRHEIRVVGKSVPNSLLPAHSTVAQELEPEYITMVDTLSAYVTFQENNMVAKISLKDGSITDSFIVGPKHYSNYGLDGSDRDGGIHMHKYPLFGNRQPDVVKSVIANKKPYLIMADEGSMTVYSKAEHGFQWSEGERARVVEYQQGLDIQVINNASFIADLNDDGKLGRLYLSKIDGLNPFTSKVEDVYTYGGRGFSIWDPTGHKLLYDSGAELERRAKDSYYNVFNTDIHQPTVFSPETLKDTVSDNMGPKPNGLDVLVDNGETFLVVGSEPTGIIYLYNITITSSAAEVDFQDIYRRGKTDSLYQDLYDAAGDDIGDMYISDIGLIPAQYTSNNRTMFYVLGAGSGSVSLYEIENLGPDLPPLNP